MNSRLGRFLERVPFPLQRPASWGILALLVVVVVGVPSYLRRKKLATNPLLPSAEIKMEPHLELKFKDVVVRGRDKGTSRWEIRVPEMSVSQNQRVVYFNDKPTGKFLNLKDWNDKKEDKRRNRVVDWHSETAQYDNDFQELSIKGKAVFVTDEKDVLVTEEVVYRQRENLVFVPTRLRMDSHDKKMVMQADKATADTKLEVLELGGNVQVDSAVNEEEKL